MSDFTAPDEYDESVRQLIDAINGIENASVHNVTPTVGRTSIDFYFDVPEGESPMLDSAQVAGNGAPGAVEHRIADILGDVTADEIHIAEATGGWLRPHVKIDGAVDDYVTAAQRLHNNYRDEFEVEK